MEEIQPSRSNEEIIEEAKRRIDTQGKAEIIDILGKLELTSQHQSDRNRADNIACLMERTDEYVVYFLPWEKDRIYVKRNPNYNLNKNIKRNNTVQSILTLVIFLAAAVSATVAAFDYIRAKNYDNKTQQDTAFYNQQYRRLENMLQSHIKKDSFFKKRVKDSVKTLP